MFSLYIPRNSVIHRMSPELKLLLLLVSGAAIFFVHALSLLILGVILAGGLYFVARLPLRTIVFALKPLLFLGTFIFVLQWAFAGWEIASITLLRILSLVLLSSLVTLTTPLSDMIDVITCLARPLSRFGISAPQIALAIALTIRFIPSLLADLQEIQRARLARGAKGPSILAAGPLILKILHMTNALGDAIAARGFENRK